MKKLFITVLLVLFATAAYAEVNFELSGSFHARGSYWDNYNLDSSDTVTYSDYDGDLILYPKIIVGDSTIIMKLAIRDETWDAPDTWRSTAAGYEIDDNISVERCWLDHKFGENTILSVGLMDGAVWGTTFADNLNARYRVKVVTKTDIGAIGALVEKMSERGNPNVDDAEKDDWDDYAVFMVTKAGDIFVKPLIYYIDNSSQIPTLDEDGVKVLYLALELSGDLGDGLGFESEIGWKDYDVEDLQGVGLVNATDYSVYGAYLNVWKALDAAKVGGILAYGSWDEDGGATGTGGGWDFGEDFESNLILGDWIALSPSGYDDLEAFTLIKLYASDISTPVDKLTGSVSAAYMMSNMDDQPQFEDVTAMELDLGVAYAISDNLTYSVNFGYATIDQDQTGVDDPDPVMLLQHRLKLSF